MNIHPTFTRRRLLGGAAAAALAPASVFAQSTWPTRPITLVMPATPGGSTDALARQVAELLGKELGQPMVVKNVAGASGSIGMGEVARAAPDGYTLAFSWTSQVVNKLVMKDLPYDPIKNFSPIGLVGGNVNVMVTHSGFPAKDLREMVEYGKKHVINYASAGEGTMTHLNAEQFGRMAGVKLNHIPYKGTAPAQIDLLGGRIDFMFDVVSQIKPHMDAGKMRALGTTGVRRHPLIPDVPTISELLPGYEFQGWFGIVGPAGMPPEIVQRLNALIVKVTGTDSYKQKLVKDGYDEATGTPEQIRARMEKDVETWAQVVKWAKIGI